MWLPLTGRMQGGRSGKPTLDSHTGADVRFSAGVVSLAMDMIPGQGFNDARGPVTDCEKLMREIAGFWDFDSLVLDNLCTQMNASLPEQEAWENAVGWENQ